MSIIHPTGTLPKASFGILSISLSKVSAYFEPEARFSGTAVAHLSTMLNKLIVILFLSLTPYFAQAFQAGSCESQFFLKSRDFQGHYVAVEGGIGHGRLHSQGAGEDCWAQAITSLVETMFFIKSGKRVNLSPEHDLFWHSYLQVQANLGKFKQMRAEYLNPNPSARTQRIQKEYQEAYGLGPSGHVNVNLGFQLDVGADAKEAIDKISFSGVVPSARYDQQITTDEKEKRIEQGLAHFVGNYLLKADNFERYSAKHNDKDGVNTALFNDLVTSLMSHERAITQVPFRPDQEFKYRNRVTTPRRFLTEDLQFDPKDYQYVKTSPTNQKIALRAIAESIRIGLPALVGMELFGDDDVWMKEQTEGLLSDATCAHNCKVVTGQHELLIVNYIFKDYPLVPTAIIVQNSWGRLGNRDINGNKTRNPKKMGYYVISVEYLNRDEKNGPWDLLISKILAGTIPPAKPKK